nr:zinc finger BED domain-containing protein 1-like [Crassostrea gigas]
MITQEIFPYPNTNVKSTVWKYFRYLKKNEGPATKANLDMTYAVCRLCFKKYANKGNTTNFKIHIASEHPGESSNKVTNSKTPIQSTISNYIGSTPKGKISPERQKNIDDSLAKLVVGKMLPVSIVDNKYFISHRLWDFWIQDTNYQVDKLCLAVCRRKKMKWL